MANFSCFFLTLWMINTLYIIDSVKGSSHRSKPIKEVVHVSDVLIEVIPFTPSPSNSKNGRFNRMPSTSNKQSSFKHSSSTLCSEDSFFLHLSIPRYSAQKPINDYQHDDEGSFTMAKFVLFLEPSSSQLLHPDAKIVYQSTNLNQSDPSLMKPQPILANEVLAYSGSIIYTDSSRNFKQSPYLSTVGTKNSRQPNGWASILVHHSYGTTCVDTSKNLALEGAFEFDGRLWHIKSLQHYQKSKGPHDSKPITPTSTSSNLDLVAWWNSDPSASDKEIQNHVNQIGTAFNQSMISFTTNSTERSSFQSTYTAKSSYSHLQKRQTMASDIAGLSSTKINYADTIGSTDGCPTTPKMVYIGIAVDCTYLRRYGSVDAIRLTILNNMNIVTSLYQRQFNISLGIVEINIPTDLTCPSHPFTDRPWNLDCPDSAQGGLVLDERLNKFSQWRSDKGDSDGAGLWHL